MNNDVCYVSLLPQPLSIYLQKENCEDVKLQNAVVAATLTVAVAVVVAVRQKWKQCEQQIFIIINNQCWFTCDVKLLTIAIVQCTVKIGCQLFYIMPYVVKTIHDSDNLVQCLFATTLFAMQLLQFVKHNFCFCFRGQNERTHPCIFRFIATKLDLFTRCNKFMCEYRSFFSLVNTSRRATT